MIKRLFFIVLVFINCCCLIAQTTLPYKNKNLPVEVRVKDLLNRMTAQEKFWQLL
jgi:beta-glucosidase